MKRAFVYRYWGKTDVGKRMIDSGRVSETDLLFLIPNNVKRCNGLPASRSAAKIKSQDKQRRKRFILSWRLFPLVEEIVESILSDKFENNEFFDSFVELRSFPNS